MSEQLKGGEHRTGSSVEHVEVRVERKEMSSAEKREAHEHQKNAEHHARESAEKLALTSSEQASKKEGHAESEHNEIVLSKSYKSVMHRVEAQLPAYQRTFSKFIRDPAVDKASVIVGSTVARPSGIIGGAAVALIGLIIFGYVAKNVGFELPNSLFVILVIVGWASGLLLELVYKTIRRVLPHKS